MHRWLAYGLGAVVALWVVTGVVMIFPQPPSIRVAAAPTIDPALAVRSPNEAAGVLPEIGQGRVRSVSLRDLTGRLVYHFALRDGQHFFVDAATAQRVELTDSLALALARMVMRGAETKQSVTRIGQHDTQYRSGALPAHRIQLHDRDGTLIHVAADASISVTNKRSRLRAMTGGLHEFQLPGNRVPSRIRKGLLVGSSVLTIILVATGYVLVLPVRRTARHDREGA